MTDAELLAIVKTGLFGSDSGTWRDELLQVYITETKGFMRDAGVPDSVIDSIKAAGCIVMCVNDLWNYNGGGVKLSEYSKQRITQLASGARGDAS